MQERWEAIERGDTTCYSAGGELLSVYPDDHPESCMACLYPTERRRLEDVVYKLRHKPMFKDTEVLDVNHEPEMCLSRHCCAHVGDAKHTMLILPTSH